ncbi:L-glutamate gamma-semialdehyde dehydrogenase [Sphingobacterium spiritivorum]|uniref:L-glutamate gamma-semialdehyde dehydrogenase n=1 Tax=Sphingobacterium spiritivorum ATCC 33861 TaxID=525373 RepID=D7VHD3_SPHSI|nr:L-glutamate gamma-semialdehyde dehydrogenase [Sphingobacterium spiritivorum]EFK59485.1 1-pyrroline-5-carboxylate dehydrogenase [Sphingobacterium spiritivorum ATCC 33861]QQT37845.1 L-glutamate gamma-semialdehyde dehydrogenase [Sphingobacterium spiritivorum]WQD34654.1 L-glutamate gamma-semialdehyde dehydrogenase [Sphingobacterium spiritivorum]SUI97651.1 1-pyrroline-5-carboxylate dehydrogenase [Sphingobacterium spiritivorum]
MLKGFFKVPVPVNEPVYTYAVGSNERKLLKAAIEEARSKHIDVPMFIGGKEIRTDKKNNITPPHDHQHVLGQYSEGTKTHVTDAINAALAAKKDWENLAWEDRAAIFLKAADLIAGKYRYKLNAATMLGQSKNPYQAEIDSACEIVDFLRFNVQYMSEIYAQQPPVSGKGVWNRLEQRPLEGFVFALTPFNFTAIAGNLPSCVAMMGNVVVWKPSNTQIYSANVLMEIFREAGLPDGVINLVFVSGPDAGDIIFKHPDFAGIHFTGSTGVFQNIWKTIGENIHLYKTYPRIVGETGGKDFILVHPSADLKVTNTAIVRGAFEYQGQKCSAASRVYIPKSLWPELKKSMIADIQSFTIGGTEDFTNFINAVIDEKSFDKLAKYIERAKDSADAEIIVGGTYDKSKGYFIHPTVIVANTPDYETLSEELFGPVLTVYVYEDEKWEETLELVDKTSIYALTGSVIAQDRYAITQATHALRNAAGNFYVNDKCTGAVVGQQPFGGARGSGTNDKAGSMINLLRWVSPRTIKETFNPDTDYRYPFLEKGE